MQENIYDVIIIGAGPAGLTAAIYSSRALQKTLLIEKMGPGGQAAITDLIENYPGFPEGIHGFELSMKLDEQARKFGVETLNDDVVSIESNGKEKTVKTVQGSYKALAVIIASGASHKHLGCPGETEMLGKGVSYCATCDGPFFKGKEVVVAGGGDSAVQEAIYLTRFASKVVLVHRRKMLRAAKILQEKAKNTPKLELKLGYKIKEITGTDAVEGIVLQDVSTSKEEVLKTNGVFIFVGYVPNTEYLKNTVKLDDKGYCITDDEMRTNIEGIFACGDVRKKLLKQVVTACGDGATAAFSAQEYIDNLKGTAYK